MYKVFVDGQHGTTGLRIHEYLSKHPDVEILNIDYEKRRDLETRKQYLNEADIVFLCLPDSAAKEAVSLIENDHTKVIDASTAHRVNEDWAYGIPELGKEYRDKIRNSKRISVPGCHASAVIIPLAPLVKAGIVPSDYPLSIFTITGYSGGGKQMIAKYEDEKNEYLKIPRPYALELKHKHLPEIRKHAGLSIDPIFIPTVCNFYKGLAANIPLYTSRLSKYKKPEEISSFLKDYYAGEKYIRVIPYGDNDELLDGSFDITACNDTNNVDIFVFGNEERILLTARLDNLGKGASGAAIQDMNITLGLDESTAL